MSRSKTNLRHVDNSGNVVRVTSENGNFYIGNSNDRAEGKMTHYNNIDYNGTYKPLDDDDDDFDDWD